MINGTHFILRMRAGFINRAWLAIAISLFSSVVSAQTYPISGVWVAKDDRFSRFDGRGVFASQRRWRRCPRNSVLPKANNFFRGQAI